GGCVLVWQLGHPSTAADPPSNLFSVRSRKWTTVVAAIAVLSGPGAASAKTAPRGPEATVRAYLKAVTRHERARALRGLAARRVGLRAGLLRLLEGRPRRPVARARAGRSGAPTRRAGAHGRRRRPRQPARRRGPPRPRGAGSDRRPVADRRLRHAARHL